MNAFFDTPEFHDIDQFMECALKFMDIQSIQIQPGLLFIKDHYLEIDGIVINHYSTNRNLLDRFSIRPRHVNFVLTSSTTNQGKWCGIDVPINAIAVLHPHREHQVLMPENWDSFGITIKYETIVQESLLSEFMWKQTLQPEKGLFKHQSFRIELFRSKLLSYFKIPGLLTALIKNDSAKLAFRNWILNEIRIIFIEIENYLNPRNTLDLSPSKRYRVYSNAVAMIEENLASQLSIKQICDQIGTTPRTLQMSFKGLMGISPLQYISARRLHAVRQAFFKTPAKSISYIAQDYGLQHAGRLSEQYKRMFFELPSETLKRRV